MSDFSPASKFYTGERSPQSMKPPLTTAANYQSSYFDKHNGTLKSPEKGISLRDI